MKKAFVYIIAVAGLISSCVPARKLEECNAEKNAAQTELANLKKSAQECETKVTELKEQMVKNEKENVGLRRDTNIVGSNYRNLTEV